MRNLLRKLQDHSARVLRHIEAAPGVQSQWRTTPLSASASSSSYDETAVNHKRPGGPNLEAERRAAVAEARQNAARRPHERLGAQSTTQAPEDRTPRRPTHPPTQVDRLITLVENLLTRPTNDINQRGPLVHVETNINPPHHETTNQHGYYELSSDEWRPDAPAQQGHPVRSSGQPDTRRPAPPSQQWRKCGNDASRGSHEPSPLDRRDSHGDMLEREREHELRWSRSVRVTRNAVMGVPPRYSAQPSYAQEQGAVYHSDDEIIPRPTQRPVHHHADTNSSPYNPQQTGVIQASHSPPPRQHRRPSLEGYGSSADARDA